MDKQSDDAVGLDRIRAIYGIDAAGSRSLSGPGKPKGCWNSAEAARHSISPSMTLQGVEAEAKHLGMDPFSALGAFLAASKLGRGKSGSRGLGLQALG